MSADEATEQLPESKLGTKEHWDSVYECVFALPAISFETMLTKL